MFHEIVVHITAKRLHLRNEHSSIRHGVAFHIVEVAIAVRLVVIVQSVGSQYSDDRLAFHLLLGDVVEVYARGVALVFHVETELVLLHLRGEHIHVLHHQVPVALPGIVAGVLERFHEEGLLGVADVAGKLAHLIGHAARGILVCHRHHLVGLDIRAQRHIAEGGIHCIVGGREQTGTLQFFEVGTAHQSGSLQGGGSLVDVSCRHHLGGHRLVFRIGLVGWHLTTRRPHRVAQLGGLSQICQSHDVTSIGCIAGLVGHPYLHTVDGDACGKVGQFLHPGIIVVAEITGEEEVTVFLIVGDVEFEGRKLNASLS